jgi:hypothetical protein
MFQEITFSVSRYTSITNKQKKNTRTRGEDYRCAFGILHLERRFLKIYLQMRYIQGRKNTDFIPHYIIIG